MSCDGCKNGDALEFEISMAFQPIVDLTTQLPFAYEALVRGPCGESAASVLAQVNPGNRYAFDQRCRVRAIELATAAGILNGGAKLSINFLPNAVYSPAACIKLTLATAKAVGLPSSRLIFEFTENEEMVDPAHIAHIVKSYQQMGFGTALDDFGAGHAGLNLLARFQPDIIKLDMELVRGIEASMPRRMIVDAVIKLAAAMGILVIAEGIETEAELSTLTQLGVRYIQGFIFAQPMLAALPAISIPYENISLRA
ncbi:EAL domain-containing protein [Sphingomonas sp. GB1N7]|uniref:EAL domain-containing protein n=1 Tax=Parasphingomonas caseinilytica TaxID=3096158 RepID=UPI002FCA46E9